MSEALLWLDIETTGLNGGYDDIIEAAYQTTTLQGHHLPYANYAMIHSVNWDKCNEYVTNMHTHSGLMADYDATVEWKKVSLHLFVDRIWAAAERLKEDGYKAVHLAGASVHFDRNFLYAKGFNVDPLTHRHVDVSSLKLALQGIGRWDRTVTPKPRHRAWEDVQDEISEYRHLLRVMGRK